MLPVQLDCQYHLGSHIRISLNIATTPVAVLLFFVRPLSFLLPL